MEAKSIYKVPEGKLLKISLEFNDVIKKVRITGDYFLYPEEENESIEKCLVGKEFNKENLVDEIKKTVQERKIELFGLTPEAIVEAIFLAKEGKK